MARRKVDDSALTEDEIAFLKSNGAADPVRKFVSRQHETVGVRTNAYRKVAAAARAEYDALLAVAHVQLARERSGMVRPPELDEANRVVQLANENRELRQALHRIQEATMQDQVAGALAVNSDD